MGTTSNRSYPYPAGSDPVDVPGDIQALADDVDTDMAAVIAYDTAYAAKSSAYTLLGTDRVVDVTGTTTVTLPAAASHTGRVYTIRNTGSATVTVSGVTSLALAGKGSATVVSDGSAWTVVDATYTDESVGRRIFTWDAVNGRWQMTYGDTGWRNVTADLVNAWAGGSLYLRRVGSTVDLRFIGLDGSSSTNVTFYALPAGFTQPVSSTFNGFAANESAASLVRFNIQSTGNCTLTAADRVGTQRGFATFTNTAAWPASLPGSAVGSIPS